MADVSDPVRIQVVIGSTRTDRFSDRVVAPTRQAVHVLPEVMRAARSGAEDPLESLAPRLELLIEDLVWWTLALRTARRA